MTSLPAAATALIAQLERIASQIDPTMAPTLLGELERIKAIGMRRMIAPIVAEARRALLTADEAAEFLNVPVSWVEESARTGRLASVKLGRYVRFRKEDLLQQSEGREHGNQEDTSRQVRSRLPRRRREAPPEDIQEEGRC